MPIEWSVYGAAPLVIGVGLAAMAVYSWRHRATAVSLPFVLLLAAVSTWTTAYGFEILSLNLDPKIFFSKLEYVGIVAVAPTALVLALSATGRSHWISGRRLLALGAVPAITLTLALTNEMHGWIWARLELVTSGPFPALAIEHGPGYFLNLAYSNVCLALATAMLIRKYSRIWRAYRVEATLVLSGFAAPWIANLLYVTGIDVVPNLDLTPFAFALTGVALGAGLHHGLLDVVRVARTGIVEGMSDGVVVLDVRDRLIDINAAGRRVLGLETSPIGLPISTALAAHTKLVEFLSQQRTGRSELRFEVAGTVSTYELELNPISDSSEGVASRILILRDITERIRSEERIRILAFYDGLTGLPNRQRFRQQLGRAIEAARHMGHHMALLFIDLDGFKKINDSFGHTIGDRLLREVAARFEGSVRLTDLIARPGSESSGTTAHGSKTEISRLGGDEFTVLLGKVSDPMDAAHVARRILEALERPVLIDQHEVFTSASIGIASYPEDGEDEERLLRNADIAMYHAKSQGRNNYQFYTDSMNAAGIRKMQVESRLRRALEEDELAVNYQPIRDCATAELIGAEALVRWTDQELGVVGPDEFIPIAEESGLIRVLGSWVLREACFQAEAWRRQGHRAIRMAVNVSGHQLRYGRLLCEVQETLVSSGLSAGLLVLEITESTITEDDEPTMAALRGLSELGVGLALDDFGTGFSSLSHLRRFPLDHVKIDRSFVGEIPSNSDDCALTAAIIAMAHGLRLSVIAEGVETREQLDFLREQGCDEVQGFLFSQAVPASEFARFLQRDKDE